MHVSQACEDARGQAAYHRLKETCGRVAIHPFHHPRTLTRLKRSVWSGCHPPCESFTVLWPPKKELAVGLPFPATKPSPKVLEVTDKRCDARSALSTPLAGATRVGRTGTAKRVGGGKLGCGGLSVRRRAASS